MEQWSKESEKEILDEWLSSDRFAIKMDGRPFYSIDTPPPYINTPIHIGHATTYTIMDMFARFKRMSGFNVLFPLGLDKNGLPIEMAAEKRFNVKLKDVDRESFIGMCRKVLEEAGAVSLSSFKRLGIGFNSWKIGTGLGEIYETDSEDYRALTQATFIDLWEKGLIYEDERLNNYCPGCKTTLADSEVERKEVEAFLNYVRFKLKDTGEDVVIATTRPELLCTAAMVIYNPSDQRYKHLNGKTAVVPVFNIELKIVEDEEANPEFGTGLVFMSASAGDQDAIRFLRKRNIKPVMAVGPEGLMLDIAGPLKGLPTRKAREQMISILREGGFIERQEEFQHSVPICERSKDEIEFIAMPEYYVSQVKLKKKMLSLAKKVDFYDESSRQILVDWINSISIDWPISRRRYYATEIPLWHCTSCGRSFVPPKGRYYRPWMEKAPVSECGCGSTTFRGEERVLDTWFDSSNSPLYILRYSKDDSFFEKHSPCTLRPQGKEIVRTWLYYTLLKSYLLTGKPIFRESWIHFHVVDEKGKKMSKSKGNVVNPQEILDRFGAEPFRLWCAMEGNLEKGDFRCSFERIEGAGKTIVKLWNVAKFISMFPVWEKPEKILDLDAWILNEMNEIVIESRKRYDAYDFHNPSARIRHFLWETFASHYIELVKNRAYNRDAKFTEEEQRSACYALHCCLDVILKLWAPVIPFITFRIFKELRGKDIHFEDFPVACKKARIGFSSEDLAELNRQIWKSKKEKGLSLRAEVKKATIPKKFRAIGKDLVFTHNIIGLSWGPDIQVEL
ncbi:valine--tRNA ligase [Candidatus Woesearchaeota archaeon]|nr:valine--tRNA ligase [Candidatus Woesearchaeota archaeon]